jgi:hypothetical protein
MGGLGSGLGEGDGEGDGEGEGVGEGDGEGDGEGEGVGDGVGVGDGEGAGGGELRISSGSSTGSGNETTGSPWVARLMNEAQISAGNDPPVTSMPWTGRHNRGSEQDRICGTSSRPRAFG